MSLYIVCSPGVPRPHYASCQRALATGLWWDITMLQAYKQPNFR